MTLDARARAIDKRLIDKFGKSVTLTGVTEGSYDPATGNMSASSSTTQTVIALIGEFKGFILMSGLVESNDKKLTIPAIELNNVPQIGDTVTIDSIVYGVLTVKPLWSGELVAHFVLQVRK